MHSPFAVRFTSDNQSSSVFLNSGCKNFAGTGTVAIHQNDQWNSPGLFVVCPFRTLVSRRSTPCGDDVTAGQEFIGKADGSGQQSTGIASHVEDQAFHSLRQNFIHWIQTRLDLLGFSSSPRHTIVRESQDNWGKAVSLEIVQGNYGRIFICSNPFQPWRERLLYNQREKVMIHLGTHPHPQRVLVPIDLSDTTLLVMKFLEKIKKTTVTFHFVHVMTHPTGLENQQWNELKHIAEFNGDIPLDLIFTRTTVVAALVKLIETQKYGTLVMGKRGLSGIKRWLLGSVSAGVLRALTDQSLILID